MKQQKRIFYGWWIVVGAFLLNFAGIGIIMNCYGIFIKPVVEALGFTRGGFTLYFSIAAISMMVTAPIIGKLLERHNIRLVMTICTAMMSASFALFSQCDKLWQFYVLSVFLGIGSAGSHIIPVSMMITNWFVKKRGLAMGIVFAATGIGGLIFNPLTNQIILDYGWSAAYLILGGIIGIATIPVALFIVRVHPREMGLQPYGAAGTESGEEDSTAEGLTASQSFRTATFWLLAIMILFIAVANMGVLHHIVPYLTDLGYSSTTAASLMSLHMGLLVIGKVCLGGLADRIGLSKSLIVCMVGLVASIGFLYNAQYFWVAVAFNIIFGFSISVRTVLPPLMTSVTLGQKHFGVIYGFLNIFTTLGTAVGVPLSGFIHDWTQSYNYAFALYMIIGVLAAAMGLIALARGRIQAPA
ncbi:MAG: MFS transporter [Spirochaetes bacterium]|nr:MFS transporter [Spirochaetota bacterium]